MATKSEWRPSSRGTPATPPPTVPWRGRSRLRARWHAALATLLLLTAATGFVSLVVTRQVTRGFGEAAEQLDRDSAVIKALREAAALEEGLGHNLLDDGSSFAPALLEADAATGALFVEAGRAFERPDEIALVDEARSQWQAARRPLLTIAAEPALADLYATGLDDASVDALHRTVGTQLALADTTLDQLDELSRQGVLAQLDRAATDQQRQTIILSVLLCCSVATTVAFGRRLSTSILRPIQELWAFADRFANGDLDHRLEVQRSDELGELADRFNDMATALSANHQRLTIEANHDALTGLLNRNGFDNRLQDRWSAGPAEQGASVLFIDLDDFKTVNDTMGHDAGDALLRETAERLRLAARSSDVVARLGGDEFAILLGAPADEVSAANVAQRVLDELARPFRARGGTVTVGASIGLASRAAGAQTVADLVRQADVAMYTAKGRGKNRLEAFDPLVHGHLLERRAEDAVTSYSAA